MFTYLLTIKHESFVRRAPRATHGQTSRLLQALSLSLSLLSQRNGTEEKDFEKRKCFKEDLKELTDVA